MRGDKLLDTFVLVDLHQQHARIRVTPTQQRRRAVPIQLSCVPCVSIMHTTTERTVHLAGCRSHSCFETRGIGETATGRQGANLPDAETQRQQVHTSRTDTRFQSVKEAVDERMNNNKNTQGYQEFSVCEIEKNCGKRKGG